MGKMRQGEQVFLVALLFRCNVVKVFGSILILMKFHIQVITTYELSKELLCVGSWDRLLSAYMNKMWLF